ncbi:MAG: Ig-like domain-containing protein [Gemmatimonadales bacterium]|nr:Ig-like domain-containing protein [Gemmatimonadales bacterium]
MRRAATRLGAGALAALALWACGGDGGNGGDDCDPIAAGLVERIEVTPSTGSVNLGDSLQLRARAFSCEGELPQVQAFTWRSESPATASVGNTGLVKGLQVGGPVRVFAAAQGREGSASVSVGAVPVASVRVEPATATVAVGRTSTLTATALDAQGRPLAGRTATWTSAAPGTVSVSTAGEITGVSVGGPVAVTATIEGRSSASQVTVVNVPVASVTVAPPTATIAAGGTTTLTATLRDDAGNVLTGRAVAWTSSDERAGR